MALTKRDLAAIREIVREEVRVATEKFITKDEFYKTADKITLSASHAQVSDLDERTAALEQIHPQGTHPSL